jgi:hypothetical protein
MVKHGMVLTKAYPGEFAGGHAVHCPGEEASGCCGSRRDCVHDSGALYNSKSPQDTMCKAARRKDDCPCRDWNAGPQSGYYRTWAVSIAECKHHNWPISLRFDGGS